MTIDAKQDCSNYRYTARKTHEAPCAICKYGGEEIQTHEDRWEAMDVIVPVLKQVAEDVAVILSYIKPGSLKRLCNDHRRGW